MKVLALDFGLRRMGFAVGDTQIGTASPLKQLDRKNKQLDLTYIKNLVEEYEVEQIVMGYPLNMDGSKSDFSARVERFSRALEKACAIPIEFMDERLTSFEAEELIKEHIPDFKKRKKMIDSISAMIILQSYMEKLNA